MAARESQEMKKARKLVLDGATPYAAAKECGITAPAIYQAPWYRAYIGKAAKVQKVKAPAPVPTMKAKAAMNLLTEVWRGSKNVKKL